MTDNNFKRKTVVRKKRKPVDGANDNKLGNVKWIGKFFTPVVGAYYKVPLNAGNYGPLRGKMGECLEFHQSGFGLAWASIDFDGELGCRWVRTSYLVDMDGNQGTMDQEHVSHLSPAQMFSNVWENGGNSGTVNITGKL